MLGRIHTPCMDGADGTLRPRSEGVLAPMGARLLPCIATSSLRPAASRRMRVSKMGHNPVAALDSRSSACKRESKNRLVALDDPGHQSHDYLLRWGEQK